MTEWERQKEREEFSKTARIFQPLSSTLASRFRRSEDAVKDKKEMESEPMVCMTMRLLSLQCCYFHIMHALCS